MGGLNAKWSCENLKTPGHSREAGCDGDQCGNITDKAVERMEGQLRIWSVEIDGLVARTQRPGIQAGFDALMHIDELKALHAIAQSRLDEFRAVGEAGQPGLKAEMESAWHELDTAFKAGGRRRTR
jgi:hypothetical protein